MNRNLFLCAVTVAFIGCRSGMYTSTVSVEKTEGGVSGYTIVKSLDESVSQLPMPVVVDANSTTTEGEHTWNNLFFLLSLGIVPGVFSEVTTGYVKVLTPLGEHSGTYTVEADWWIGWLPMFLPYPGFAEERSSNPKLPNAHMELKARSRLVENIVSQIKATEYDAFIARRNSQIQKERLESKATSQERSQPMVDAVEQIRKVDFNFQLPDLKTSQP